LAWTFSSAQPARARGASSKHANVRVEMVKLGCFTKYSFLSRFYLETPDEI
jgi:hypothetical protein